MSWVFIRASELQKDKELLEAVKQLPVLWSFISGAFVRSVSVATVVHQSGVYAVWIGNTEEADYSSVQGHSASRFKHLWDN